MPAASACAYTLLLTRSFPACGVHAERVWRRAHTIWRAIPQSRARARPQSESDAISSSGRFARLCNHRAPSCALRGRSPMKLSLLALLSAARALHVHHPARPAAGRSSALTRRALLGGAGAAALIGPEQARAASLYDNVKNIENSNPPDQRNVQAEFSNAVRLTDAGAALCRIEFSISDSTPPEFMCETSLRLPPSPRCATPGGVWPERRGVARRAGGSASTRPMRRPATSRSSPPPPTRTPSRR